MDQHPSVATKYRELEGSQIRLLSVAPGSLDGPISCTMHHVPLDERPEYVALSYTWGDANDRVRILLNGKEHEITRSLFGALQRFRYHCSRDRSFDGFTFREGMYLWADALCINQEDGHEKGSQIPRMSEIYTRCSRVCVWLGQQEDAVDPHVFQELLEEYREYCEFTQRLVREMDVGQLALLKEAIEEALGDVFVEGIFRVLCNLASRAWFRRVWVIQEAALPAKDPILMAGPFLFGFESFTRVCEIAFFIWGKGEQAPPAHRSAARHLVDHAALLRGRIQMQKNPVQARGDLEDRTLQFGRVFEKAVLGWGYGQYEAKELHDYIYGMIGLCGGNEMLPPALAPDYAKPFRKVCEDYARCVIESTGSVAILARGISFGFDGDDQDGLPSRVPSWVPDLSTWQQPMIVRGDPNPGAASFVGLDGRLMKIRGFSIGKVTAVYLPLVWESEDDISVYDEEDEDFDFSSHLQHHHKFLRKVAKERKVRPKDAVADWLANNIKREDAWSTQPTTQALLKMYYYFLHQDGGDSLPSLSQYDPDVVEKFVRLAGHEFTHRHTFLCRGGVHGEPGGMVWKTGGVRRGDYLVALSGSRPPFLLRPTPTPTTEGPGYVLLGQCSAYDGTSELHYTHNDFRASLEHHAERKLEYFIIA